MTIISFVTSIVRKFLPTTGYISVELALPFFIVPILIHGCAIISITRIFKFGNHSAHLLVFSPVTIFQDQLSRIKLMIGIQQKWIQREKNLLETTPGVRFLWKIPIVLGRPGIFFFHLFNCFVPLGFIPVARTARRLLDFSAQSIHIYFNTLGSEKDGWYFACHIFKWKYLHFGFEFHSGFSGSNCQ